MGRDADRMNNPCLYVKLREITELNKRQVQLKDVAQLYCRDPRIKEESGHIVIRHIPSPKKHRYVVSALEVIEKIQHKFPETEVSVMGSEDLIIAYCPPSPPRYLWQQAKTLFVSLVSFFGGAFAIMTFNNDSDVTDVFKELYTLVMGQPPQGVTIVELGYSLGLALGILVFFNHFAGWKINTDPTPLEVEMRLYEDNISKTVIAQSDRKEKKIDIT